MKPRLEPELSAAAMLGARIPPRVAVTLDFKTIISIDIDVAANISGATRDERRTKGCYCSTGEYWNSLSQIERAEVLQKIGEKPATCYFRF